MSKVNEEVLEVSMRMVSVTQNHRALIEKINEDEEFSGKLKVYARSIVSEHENNVNKAEKIFEQRLSLNKEKLIALLKDAEDLCDPENLLKDQVKDLLPSCEICLNNYDHNEHWQSCITVCGHMFGKSCIERSFESNNRCPKCNKIFEKKDILTLF